MLVQKNSAILAILLILLTIFYLSQVRLLDFAPEKIAPSPASSVGEDPTTPTLVPTPIIEPTFIPSPTPTTEPTPTVDILRNFAGQNLFDYGVQVNWTNVDNNQEMTWVTRMGFRWVKAQVRWCDFERSRGNIDFGQIDQLMGAARAKGIKVMFSVVCSPGWARIVNKTSRGLSGPPDNLQEAADFMSKLAARYCGGTLGAIEVWNEYNLLTEWDDKRGISAALYIDMLKRSYASIKAKCPSLIVVSGALTPTGVTNDTAIDDVAFLQQLYTNGLKQYSDAVGAHPSGFANAADAPVGASNPTGQFQGHRSFYFRGTMESYRAIMVQNGDGAKQIWPTELGWGVDPSPKPGYEYEKSITEDQQAQWLVKSYQLMKQWGWVGVAFVWNLDFTDMGNETGAFHIVNRAAYNQLAGMAK